MLFGILVALDPQCLAIPGTSWQQLGPTDAFFVIHYFSLSTLTVVRILCMKSLFFIFVNRE